jgi:hypothetical protein
MNSQYIRIHARMSKRTAPSTIAAMVPPELDEDELVLLISVSLSEQEPEKKRLRTQSELQGRTW